MSKGWIYLHRSIFDNPFYFAEKFTKSQAWIDLLLLANHSTGYVDKRGNLIEVKRGYVGYSKKALCIRWQWSNKKIDKFLKDLENAQQITQQKNGKITTLIQIVNYDKYQPKAEQTDKQKRNRSTTEAEQKHTNKELNKLKEEKESIITEVEFLDLYHDICYNLPRVKKMGTKRKKDLLKLRKELKTQEETKIFLHNLKKCDFPGKTGKQWKADIDWFTNESNYIKVMEDKYKEPDSTPLVNSILVDTKFKEIMEKVEKEVLTVVELKKVVSEFEDKHYEEAQILKSQLKNEKLIQTLMGGAE